MSISVEPVDASSGSAGSPGDSANDRADTTTDAGALARWFADKVRPGRILSVGADFWGLPVHSDLCVVELDKLATSLTHASIFDHAWVDGSVADGSDPIDLITRIHRAMKPDGVLLIAFPYGVSRVQRTRGYYLSSSRRLVEPFFEISAIAVVGAYVTVAATRRAETTAAASFVLDADEQAFIEHERRLVHHIDDLARQLIQSGARYRDLLTRQGRLTTDLARITRDLADARRNLERMRPFIALPLALISRVRRLRPPAAVPPTTPTTPKSVPSAKAPVEVPADVASPPARVAESVPPPDWRPAFRAGFDTWLQAAKLSPGDEVVVMFSGTTYVQEHRGNRPIRLTNVYLDRQCPVFFNYYRWREDEPLPDHPDELLFQSPIDATPGLLDALLTADLGGKRKTFFASFPHEVMVRYLTLAAQHGWVTIYDARDDWEEFAKVGMAKWYHPGYERYVATHADIVTAVSRPLARKVSALAGGRRAVVNPNGLDSRFPRPTGRRDPGAQPIIGYFGHLTDKWFDWPLVIATAQRYPEYRFELAGHQAPKLDLPSNVELLGLLGHQEIAERSRTWSVGVIPFKNGPLADAVDPIKIYEYLHLGLPVLTTYFPQCREYPGTVITEGRDEFMDRLSQLVGTSLAQATVAEWLRDNTWECRVDAYRDMADQVRRVGRTGAMALLGDSW